MLSGEVEALWEANLLKDVGHMLLINPQHRYPLSIFKSVAKPCHIISLSLDNGPSSI